MQMLEVPRITSTDFKAEAGYYIKEASGGLLRMLFITSLAKFMVPQTLPSFQDAQLLFITEQSQRASLISLPLRTI
jgi:hypothetical protein